MNMTPIDILVSIVLSIVSGIAGALATRKIFQSRAFKAYSNQMNELLMQVCNLVNEIKDPKGLWHIHDSINNSSDPNMAKTATQMAEKLKAIIGQSENVQRVAINIHGNLEIVTGKKST